MSKLIRLVKKNYYKIGLFLIIMATFMVIIILPGVDTKIISLEREIIDFKDQVTKNTLAWLQYTSIGNRIEVLCQVGVICFCKSATDNWNITNKIHCHFGVDAPVIVIVEIDTIRNPTRCRHPDVEIRSVVFIG